MAFYLSVASLFLSVLLLSSCKRDTAISKSFEPASKIEASFARTFSAPLESCEEAPDIGRVGELFTRSPRYLLRNFPETQFARLEAWAQPMLKSHELEAICFCYFERQEESQGRNYVTGMGLITFKKDGTIERKKGLKIEDAFPMPSMNGEKIEASGS